MKKYYIIGAVTLLAVIGGSVAFYEYEHNPKIEYQKGLHYYKEKDYKKALPLFKESAKQNYAPAEAKLGYMYLKGWGVTKHSSKAAYWFKKAAEQGNVIGEDALGRMNLTTAVIDSVLSYSHLARKGIGSKYYQRAVYWFKKAAHQGNAKGEADLGSLYLKGWGVPQDYSKAVYWFKKAAHQGNTKGENNLGSMYEYGWGVPQDSNKAFYWFKKAAEQGSVAAKLNLKYLESEH